MPANKKRKIAVLPPLPSHMNHRNRELTTSFEKFEDALCELLASASVVTNLHGVLGDEKASFVVALQQMIAVGDLTWVKEIDSDGEEVTYDTVITDGAQTPMFNGDRTPQQLPAISHAAQSPQSWPPPLPPIPNPSLRLQVFTPSQANGDDDPQSHYQRLEWLGDAYLEAVVSRILFDRFPDEREGYLTRIREKLVANRPISYLAKLYGFENRIMGIRELPDISNDGINKADEHWKLLADCFEAYVGAIAISDPGNSLETLINWLVPLYGPDIEVRRENGRRSVLKSKFRFSAAPGIRRPEFRRTRSPSVLQPLRAGQHLTRRLENTRARSRPLPGPIASKRSRQQELRESRLPTTMDENESDWEEIESLEEVVQSSTQIPLNDSAKIHLRTMLGGDDIVLDYLQTRTSGVPGGEPGKKDYQQGYQFHATILFTGCGLTKKTLGSGSGASEYEAGQRAAMAVLKDKPLLIILKQLKAGESVINSPQSLESATNDQQHHTLSSIPPYYPGSPTPTISPASQTSPIIIQQPWAPVLQPAWENMDGICATAPVQETKINTPNSVRSANIIRMLRGDMPDVVMIDDD